jgi:hypothetical protein
MPEANTLILRTPLAHAIRTTRSHVITNASQLGTINRVGSVMIGVNACDAAHETDFQDRFRAVKVLDPSAPSDQSNSFLTELE